MFAARGIMVKLVLGLVGMTLLAGVSLADCRDVGLQDDCGLEFFVSVDEAVLAPGDSVVFKMELSNAGDNTIYIPDRFFKYDVLPCAVQPSGKVEGFNAIFGAPECGELPTEGDILLGPGESIEFEKSNFALPEKGLQKWNFQGVLWECADILYSINCEIESNTVQLLVLE
jgi:hypothetical protein